MSAQGWAPGALVTRRRLGGELRRLREAAELKLDDVAKSLECSPSKISRLENGKGIPKSRDVRDILDVLGVDDDAERERLLDWSRGGQRPMWWQDYADVLPPDFAPYVELEWDAARIHAYESLLVHGLLQTRDYARAVLTNAWAGMYSARDIERLMEVRMLRQEALSPDHGLTLCCVLDESTLYRAVGSSGILRNQLEHLIGMAEAVHVDVRVLPFSAGLAGIGVSPFSKLYFTAGIEDGVVYLERPHGTASDFLYDANDIAVYTRQMDALFAAALTEEESVPLMKRAIDRVVRYPT